MTTNPNSVQPTAPTFLEAAVKLVVGLLTVTILEKLALSFPLAQDASAVLVLPLPDWVRLIAVLGMIAFFWIFTRDVAQLLRVAYPATPEFANTMTYLGVFVAVALGYNVVLPFMEALLPEGVPTFRIVAVIVASLAFLAMVVTFLRHLNLVAGVVSRALRRLLSVYPVMQCSGCNETIAADHAYCPKCGKATELSAGA